MKDLEDLNSYLKLVGRVDDPLPSEFIPLLFTIRTLSEWQRLLGDRVCGSYETGFEPIIESSCHFGFLKVSSPSPVQLEAIRTQKKIAWDPQVVAGLVLEHGVSFEDVVSIKKNVKLYVEAVRSLKNQDYVNAINNLKEAIRLNPNEDLYINLLADIRLQIGDMSAIQEVVDFYKNDMDAAVHGGHVGDWLSKLVSVRDFEQALQLIKTVDSLLDDLICGKRQNRRFVQQPKCFYKNKREEFRKDIPAFIKFKSVNAIIEGNSPSTELHNLLMIAVTWSKTSKSRILAERAGDAFNRWGEQGKALEFYRIASNYAAEGNENVFRRIQRKIQLLE